MLLWVLSSYLVLRRVDSELIASKVTTSGLVGWKPSIALTAVKLGTMNAKPPPESSQAMRRERRSASCWICAAVPGRRLHQSPDMRQERESAKLAREQLVPAVGQRARRNRWATGAAGIDGGTEGAGTAGAGIDAVGTADDAAGTGTDATGALSTDAPHAGQNRAGLSTLFPQWPQYAIVCFSSSNRLDCHCFNVTLQHYASASPYA